MVASPGAPGLAEPAFVEAAGRRVGPDCWVWVEVSLEALPAPGVPVPPLRLVLPSRSQPARAATAIARAATEVGMMLRMVGSPQGTVCTCAGACRRRKRRWFGK